MARWTSHAFGSLPLALLFVCPLPGTPRSVAPSAQTPHSQEASAPAPPRPFVFEPGAEEPPILFPRAETLRYQAYVGLAFLSASAGVVTQTTSVEEQRPSIMLVEPPPAGEAVCVRLHATGGNFMYTVDSTIEMRILPQEWPRVVYSVTNTGTERRRREIKLGRRDGAFISSYQSDTKKNAPEGERIMKPAKERAVPAGTLDMSSAVFMARTLVRENKDRITFPLLQNDEVWQLTLRRGESRIEETEAGNFEVVEVLMEPTVHPDEPVREDSRFEGAFGIHGTMHLWAEKHTGIVVRIQGDLPLGPMTLKVDVVLDSYSGTSDEFVPVK